MTLHPWHLWAYTHLTSLARSWPATRRAAAQTTIGASDGIRSTTYGRTSTGGTSDGGMLRAVEAGQDEAAHWQQLLERIAQDVTDALWLARACTPLTPARGPLGILAKALPATPPTYARHIAGNLEHADQTARRALDMPPDRTPLRGVTCPTCDRRLLDVCAPGPNPAAWTVHCGAGCHTGGAPSIWRWTVIAARSLPVTAAA